MKLNVFNRTEKSRIYLLGFLLLSFACLLNSLCVFNAFGNELLLPQHLRRSSPTSSGQVRFSRTPLREAATLSESFGQSVDERTKSNVLSAFGKLPLHFVANQGQLDKTVVYYAQSEGVTVYCTEEELVFGFAEGSVRLKFSQERRVKPEARSEFEGKVNYFIGNVPALWRDKYSHLPRSDISRRIPGDRPCV